MTINEVKKILSENNIDERMCPINVRPFAEAVLHLNQQKNGSWLVIFNDRGDFIINKTFKSESDACKFFLTCVLRDPTYRKEFKQSDLLTWKEKIAELLKKYDLETNN